MEDVLTEFPPPSRFFVEDLNNFALPSPILPCPFLVLRKPNPSPELLVVSISAPSLFLLNHATRKTLIGTLILPEVALAGNSVDPSPRDKSCNIYALDDAASTVLALVQLPVSADRSHAVARCLIKEMCPRKVLILDSIRRQNFRGRLPVDETVVYKLETSGQRMDSGGPLVKNADYYPSGSMVDGLGAALLARCQVEKVKGTLGVSWPDSNNSVVSLLKHLLEDILPGIEFKESPIHETSPFPELVLDNVMPISMGEELGMLRGILPVIGRGEWILIWFHQPLTSS